jgi:hypothetical protein
MVLLPLLHNTTNLHKDNILVYLEDIWLVHILLDNYTLQDTIHRYAESDSYIE